MFTQAFIISMLGVLAHAQQLSVGDIALGSDYTEALTKLRGKGMTIVPVKIIVSADAATLEPQTGAFAKSRDELFAIHAIGGRIIYVHRFIQFASGNEPDFNTTLDDLKHKFGVTPSLASNPNRNSGDTFQKVIMTWEWDTQHHIVSRDRLFPICQMGGGGPLIDLPGAVGYGVAGVQNLVQFGPGIRNNNSCASGASATLMTTSQNFNLIRSLDIGIVDQVAIDAYDAKLYALAKARGCYGLWT